MDRGKRHDIYYSYDEQLLKKLERDELEHYARIQNEVIRQAREVIDLFEYKIEILEDYIRTEDKLTSKYFRFNNNRDFLRQFELDMNEKHKEE